MTTGDFYRALGGLGDAGAVAELARLTDLARELECNPDSDAADDYRALLLLAQALPGWGWGEGDHD